MVRNTYSIQESHGRETNAYTIYRLDTPPNNVSEIKALTSFAHSFVGVNPDQVDGHWIIEQTSVHGRGHVERIPVGIAHSEHELPDKTYTLARDIAQRLAGCEAFDFRDLTKRAKVKSCEEMVSI